MAAKQRPGGAINTTKQEREKGREEKKDKAKITRCVGENYSLTKGGSRI